jgi:hypothetical protein
LTDIRTIEEWIGKNADEVPPPRVRVRTFDHEHGRCHRCTRKIMTGEKWTLEHRIAIINGGANREANLCLTCCNCLPEKNAEDVAEKSDVYQKRLKHLGAQTKKRRWGYRP